MTDCFIVGDEVEIRDAHGNWWPAQVTEGRHLVKYGRAHLPAVRITCAGWINVNWPIEDVRSYGVAGFETATP